MISGPMLLATVIGTLSCGLEPSDAQTVTTERISTTLQEAGVPVSLEMVIHKPTGPGPFPVVVFNHGSTGNGDDPARFTRTWSRPTFSRVLNALGWMVVFRQPRGRGGSDGICDKGFDSDRSRYSCRPEHSLPAHPTLWRRDVTALVLEAGGER